MTIPNNSPSNPNAFVTIKANVVSEPTLAVSDTCLYFSTTLVGDTAVRNLTIVNDGCQPLNVSSILPSNGSVFKVTPANANVPVDDSVVVEVKAVYTNLSAVDVSRVIAYQSRSTAPVKVVCLNALAGALPTADFQYFVTNSCLGEVSFSDESDNNPANIFWEFGDGNNSQLRNPKHNYRKPGTYKVKLTVSNNFGSDTLSQNITVYPLYVDFAMSHDTVPISTNVAFYDSSQVPTFQWLWSFGDGDTSSQQNPTHSYANKGTYVVSLEVRDSNSCVRNTTNTIVVIDDIGIDEWQIDGISYSMPPNPAEGRFYIVAPGLQWKEYHIQVSDSRGAVVAEQHPGAQISASQTWILNTSHFRCLPGNHL
ncbi:MAG: PKD domain-containing protein [Owenweeksia sp.]|nr:PKD domain-containing protein [Owenweeksia sp.]